MKKLLAVCISLALAIGGVYALPPKADAYATWYTNFTNAAVNNGISICYGNSLSSGAIWNNRGNTLDVIKLWREYTGIVFKNNSVPCPDASSENILVKLKDEDADIICELEDSLAWSEIPTGPDNYTAINVYIQKDCFAAGLFYWGTGSVPSDRIDGPSMLAHEVGHAMGICHSNNPPGNCNYFGPVSTADLMDSAGPQIADCTETLGLPFFGRRIKHASHDDGNAIKYLYPSWAIQGPMAPPVNADCVS